MDKTSKRRVYVTGIGLLSPAGTGTHALWELTKVKGTYIKEGLGRLDLNLKENESLAEHIALAAATDAMKQAGWYSLKSADGFILATTTGRAIEWENGLMRFIKKEVSADSFRPHFSLIPLGDILEAIAGHLNFNGRSQLVTTACAAGLHAITLATLWIRSGLTDRCLVGGVEVLCALTQKGFSSLQLLSSKQCKPFDVNRSGLNLAEGGAFLCLESNPSGDEKILAEIEGTGASMDAYHMTAPEPEGRGSWMALTAALKQANLHPSEVDWVHAHGTGSAHNDLAESRAIKKIFDDIPIPPVSSTKGTHGHFLGATGIIEAALIIESIQRQEILPTTAFTDRDPVIDLPVVQTSIPNRRLKHVLKNTLGFGGTNGAVVLGSP
jgi:3-oxoacyl-(acyl-carrier-protein) synthase